MSSPSTSWIILFVSLKPTMWCFYFYRWSWNCFDCWYPVALQERTAFFCFLGFELRALVFTCLSTQAILVVKKQNSRFKVCSFVADTSTLRYRKDPVSDYVPEQFTVSQRKFDFPAQRYFFAIGNDCLVSLIWLVSRCFSLFASINKSWNTIVFFG